MTITAIAGSKVTESQFNWAVTILRVTVGTVFVAHGAQKLFVYNLSGVTAAFADMGIPLAVLAAPAVTLIEFLGGIALIVGFWTRLAGFGLGVVMLGATFLVHLSGGFFAPDGVEFTLTLLAASMTLALVGGGIYSLDSTFTRRK